MTIDRKEDVEEMPKSKATLIRLFVHLYTVDHHLQSEALIISALIQHNVVHKPSTATPYQLLCKVPARKNPTPNSPLQHRSAAALPGLQHH